MKLFLPLLISAAVLGQTSAPMPKPPGPGFDALAKKADAARQQNKDDEAESLYQQALRLKPGWSEGWWFLGSLYYDGDHYVEGRDAFRHLTSLEPKMAVAWAMLGLCEFETKTYDRALAHLERANALGLSQDQGFYNVAMYHLALLWTRSEQYDAAIDLASKVAAHDAAGPQWVEAMGIAALHKPVLPSELPASEREIVMGVGRAMCDAAARRTADAAGELETLLKQYPNQPDLHYCYGIVLLVNDPDKALEQFNQELTLSPGHPEALINIANEYLKRNDAKSALPFAEKAVTSNPNYFAAHAMLGRVLVEGDLDVPRGTKELEIAEKIAPANLGTRFALASAYTKAGRKDDAARERAEFLRLRSQQPGATSDSAGK